MKVIVVNLAVLAVLAGGAALQGGTYGWDGGASTSAWSDDVNWRSDTEPPLTGGHNANLLAGYLVTPFQNVGDWTFSSTGEYGIIVVQSDATYAMTFRKSGSGSFTATTLELEGAGSSKKATLDADAALTVSNLNSTSYTTIDVASSVTVDVNGTLYGRGHSGIGVCEKIGAGSVTLQNILISGGDASGEDYRVLVSNGAITVTGGDVETSIEAGLSLNADATLTLNGASASLSTGALFLRGGSVSSGGLAEFQYLAGALTAPDTLNMYGLSKIDTDQDITTSGDLTVTVDGGKTFATEATVDVASLMDVIVERLVIGHGNYSCKPTIVGPGHLVTD